MADSTMASNDTNEGSHDETAQMMMQMMQNMADQINDNQAQVHTLQEHLFSLQQAQAAPVQPTPAQDAPVQPMPAQTTPSTTTDATVDTSTVSTESAKKPKLPDPPKFNGVRALFRPWHLEMKHKLETDGAWMGSIKNQFNYIYARLDRIPQNITSAYIEKGGSNGSHNPDEYLAYLYSCYRDPNAQAQAVDRLRTIKQREVNNFATFLPRFEKELADSGGAEWADSIQINYLEGALNHKLRDRLIGISNLPTDYSGYIQTLQIISSRLDSLELSNRQRVRRYAGDQSFQRPKEPATVTTDEMDWESTKAKRTAQPDDDEHLRGKTAKWVNQAEIDKRKKEGRCYRCGRSGCRIPKCPLKPVQRPGPTTRARRVDQALIEEDSMDDKTDQSSDDSGKE